MIEELREGQAEIKAFAREAAEKAHRVGGLWLGVFRVSGSGFRAFRDLGFRT